MLQLNRSFFLERFGDLSMEIFYKHMSYDEFDYYFVFSDVQTYEILFLNDAMCSFLNVSPADCIGKKCYNVIYNKNKVCSFCVNGEFSNNIFDSIEVIQSVKQIDLTCHISLFKHEDRTIRMTKIQINPKSANKQLGIPITVNDILADLHRNIKNNNFNIYLQPKYKIIDTNNSLETKLIGAEALVRRYDVNLNNIINPNEFIPLYETMSIIRHLDLHVLEKSCEFMAKFIEDNSILNDTYNNETIILNINFSCATLLEFDCVSNIKSICDKYSIPYHYIMIEITNDKFLNDHQKFIEVSLRHLSKLGFKLSLTKVDITSHIKTITPNVKFDEIKISNEVVSNQNIKYNEYNHTTFSNIIKNYPDNCNIVAVGIETKEQQDFYYSVGCNYQQGFFHCKALPFNDFMDMFNL